MRHRRPPIPNGRACPPRRSRDGSIIRAWAIRVVAIVAVLEALPARAATVDFGRDVRPILAENCFQCHGLDEAKRKGKLRLDVREGAIADLGGHAAVVPGKPEASSLVARVVSEHPDDRMPPPDANKSLTPAQREILRRWIAEGAEYREHWSFRRLVRPPVPKVRRGDWARGPWDAFVLARLEAEGIQPSPEATPETWFRRASFDLVGLAPTPREVDAFVADVSLRGERAYATAVDRLLASTRYGERQAQEWLDLARYADTHGFNNDTTRTMWRWRDWVIEALNSGMPYDRFLTEQLAGDLLPSADLDTRIATGFGRNHVVNSEGGIIDEEYRLEYVADRVRTVGMAWMGLTLECSRCHDHKYDPISQRDYYRLFAFFDQVAEVGEDGRIGNAAPILVAPTRPQQEVLRRLDVEVGSAERTAAEIRPSWSILGDALRAVAERGDDVAPPEAAFVSTTNSPPRAEVDSAFGAIVRLDGKSGAEVPVKAAVFSGAQAWTLATWVAWGGVEGPILSNMDLKVDPSSGGHGRGAEVRVRDDGRVEVRIAEFWPAYSIRVATVERLTRSEWRHLRVSYDGSAKASGVRVSVDGRSSDLELLRDGLTGKSGAGVAPRLGETWAKEPERWTGSLGAFRLYGRVVSDFELAPWVEAQAARHVVGRERSGGEPSPSIAEWLSRIGDPEYAAWAAVGERRRGERQAVLREAPQTMVMAELERPRTTYFLRRGRYDARGDVMTPAVPDAIGVPWPEGAPRNRLGLARWLTVRDHPLTARVVVNRVWAQLFGVGLSKTVEDVGVQGEYPSHPELLDWLATEFVETGWDMKRLLRSLVLSATYRQASTVSPELRERDPENRLLARGPRVRLSAEAIRDHALAISGLLEERVGGPSVFPVQPESLYQGVVVAADYPGTRWETSRGRDRFRRSLYTFWKRTVPHPVMTTFDAPDREFCSARRLPTNTPLQALALLNEPTYLEAGRSLARRARSEGGTTESARLAYLFRLATGREPDAREAELLERTLKALGPKPGTAGSVGDAGGGDAEESAWAAVGSLALNLDETITKN